MIVKYTKEEYDKAKSTDKLALECERCGKTFYSEKKQIAFELKNKRGRLKFCSVICSDLSHRTRHQLCCENCGKEIEVSDNAYSKSKTKHFFCSKSCAAIFNNSKRCPVSEETKEKTRKSVISYYESIGARNKVEKCETHHKQKNLVRERPVHICMVCGNKYHADKEGSTIKFCSQNCFNEYRKNRKKYLSEDVLAKLSAAGRHSVEAQSEKRRSKNEKYFYDLCKKHFVNVKHNEPMFNGWDADVIVEDVKYAILWNGKWHYEKIKESHSVKQVQNRDNIKIKEIKKCGYVPYVIKDMGKYNPQFVEEEFKKFIKNIRVE